MGCAKTIRSPGAAGLQRLDGSNRAHAGPASPAQSHRATAARVQQAAGGRRRFRCRTVEHDGHSIADWRCGLLFPTRLDRIPRDEERGSPRRRFPKRTPAVSHGSTRRVPPAASSLLDPGWGAALAAQVRSVPPVQRQPTGFAKPILPNRVHWRRSLLCATHRPTPPRSSGTLGVGRGRMQAPPLTN